LCFAQRAALPRRPGPKIGVARRPHAALGLLGKVDSMEWPECAILEAR